MIRLYIDSSKRDKIFVRLIRGDKTFQIAQMVDRGESQAVLGLIDKLLLKNKLTPKDIDEIFVEIGPGSFTGLRLGMSVANVFSKFLQIPINGKKAGTIIDASRV